MNRYLMPAEGVFETRTEVKRSHFIASATHTPTAEKAHEFIQSIRDLYPDATHHCWAFVAGPPGDTRSIGMSDDGEPHGTAGRPMLNVLLHGELGEICCVVTRYYGGTKLGTGGLARAYGHAVEENLKALPSIEHVNRVTRTTRIEYANRVAVQNLFEELEVQVNEEVFAEDIFYSLAIPEENLDKVATSLANLTLGQSSLDSD